MSLTIKADSVKPSAPQPATPADLADPNSPKLPPSVWSITGQPAAGNKATIKIIRDHPLIIKNILDEGVVIPWQTKQRHLYAGKNDLTRERVIEMSKNSDWTEKKVSKFNLTFFALTIGSGRTKAVRYKLFFLKSLTK